MRAMHKHGINMHNMHILCNNRENIQSVMRIVKISSSAFAYYKKENPAPSETGFFYGRGRKKVRR